jgi:hypothetical protein
MPLPRSPLPLPLPVALAAFLLVPAACGDSTAPAPPAAVAAVGAVDLAGAVGTTDTLVVRVTDARRRPLANVPVAWTVTAGGGAVVPVDGATTRAGEARAAWTRGTAPGSQAVSATVAVLPAVAFTATVTAGPPAALRGEDLPVYAAVDAVLEPAPAVVVRDAFGNPVPGATVSFAVTGGGGTVTGAQQTTAADGRATVGSWQLGAVAGENTLQATVQGAADVAPVTFTVQGVTFELHVDAVHLNQGSQTLHGTIGGIAGRAGVLRVVVRANDPNAFALPVRVRLFQDGTLLREETLTRATAGVPTDPDLFEPTHTWNLVLPAAQVVPGLSVVAEVDPQGTAGVRNPADRRFPRGSGTASLDVRELMPFRIVFIPVHAAVQARTGNIHPGNVEQFLTATRQWLPVATILPTIAGTYTTNVDLSDGDAWPQLLHEIRLKRVVEGARDEYYHGILPDFPGTPWGGYGYVPGSPSNGDARSAISFDRLPAASGVVAHELGHNLGRWHAPCGNPAGVDGNYPHPGAVLGSPGFNVLTNALVTAANLRDYMSYCGPQWTSDYTFRAIVNWRRADPLALPAAGGSFAAGAAPNGASAASAASAAPARGLLVWGRTDSRGAELMPAFALAAPPALPDAPGPNLLRGLDAAGRELFRVAFAGDPVDHAADPAERHFAFHLPLSDADLAALARLELTTPAGSASRAAPGTEGAQGAPAPGAAAGAAAAEPVVDVDRLAGDRLRVRWDAARHPMALVRDARTGEVLALARQGETVLRAVGRAPAEVEVLVSDGVRSRLAPRR